ncbi:aminoglycoside phosphotransferase [Paenibacillus sp. FSL R7-277]|uniref:phosphotransferase enzyme family protein n=1 Tax=Paenibacillus sp. FSL R7-277 TaxID=1227352 RepID=UPI0003E21EDD|nr:phosphotransferase [Paenibacillus sp. FSL R7-277]ETT72930.1 aminoglycoside phosphotransferase [Paenibacillus sp. FSL R7-277]
MKLETAARDIVLRALKAYELDWTKVEYIKQSDSITFKVETETAGKLLLRIHGERCNRSEILSELEWLSHLSQKAKLVVPVGLPNSSGRYILEAGNEAGNEPYGGAQELNYITLMRWVEGEHASGNLTDEQLHAVGVMLARMHEAGEQFVPSAEFTRPAWGAESFRKEWDKLEKHLSALVLEAGWKLYQAAAARIPGELEAMTPDPGSYGLIHGDLHFGNVVFADGQPRAIDFGLCGYGFYLYDLAAALLELSTEQRRSLIRGYSSVRALEPDYERKLECFFVKIMIGNYSHHISNPDELPSLREEQPYALAYLKEYLADSRFLFKRIEPVQVE